MTSDERTDATTPDDPREDALRLRALGDNLPNGFIYHIVREPDGVMRLPYVSAGVGRLLGLPPDEVTRDSACIYGLIVPEDRDRFAAAEAEAARTLGVIDETVRMRRRDGALLWIRITSRVRRRDDGLLCADGLMVDVTRQNETEERLREHQATIEGIVETSKEWIWSVDLAGRHTYSNPAVRRILGRTPGEILGAGLELLHPDDRRMVEAKMPVWIAGRKGWSNLVLRFRHRDGTWRHLESSAVPIQDAGGALTGFRGVDRDITERLRAEEEREALRGRLLEAEKLESIGRLAGGVAHDFNNMLGVILGNVEYALDALPPGHPLLGELAEIKAAAERSADLTRQLLAFARRQPVRPRTIDLNAAVEAALRMLRRLIGEEIELAWRPGEALAPVRIDPMQVDQLLANLCLNARDAIEGGGWIAIATRNATLGTGDPALPAGAAPGDYVELSVQDSGHGMNAQVRDHAFEPFFTTKEVGRGTGLGLATVLGVARQNGGHVGLESAPGRGTTVRLLLPRGAASEAEETGEAPRSAETRHERAAVLVVEDEPGILSLCRRLLDGMGHETLAAATPVEAIALAERHDGVIRLILTDVVMPGMNGRELSTRLLERHPEARVLYVSGYSGDAVAARGVVEGDVRVLPKPFTRREFEAAVREALG